MSFREKSAWIPLATYLVVHGYDLAQVVKFASEAMYFRVGI